MIKLKRLLILPLLAAALLSLCSCSEDIVIAPPHVEGMLFISDYGKDYCSCATRYNEVSTAFTEQISLFVEKNNGTIEMNSPDKYFLDENYILTSFTPFANPTFSFTSQFGKNLTEEDVLRMAYTNEWPGQISYKSTGKTSYLLRSEGESTFELDCRYNKKTDTLSYRRTEIKDDEEGDTVSEFLEFTCVGNNVYFISTLTEHCRVSFDDDGYIRDFSYSCLKDGTYDPDEDSFFNDSKVVTVAYENGWVAGADKSPYLCYYLYDGETFTYNDSSRGEWQKITVTR